MATVAIAMYFLRKDFVVVQNRLAFVGISEADIV
jgi:hypothetical protein